HHQRWRWSITGRRRSLECRRRRAITMRSSIAILENADNLTEIVNPLYIRGERTVGKLDRRKHRARSNESAIRRLRPAILYRDVANIVQALRVRVGPGGGLNFRIRIAVKGKAHG